MIIKHKLQFYRTRRGNWHWRIISVNGNVICSTDKYSSICKCRDSAKSLIESIQNKTFVEETIEVDF